MDKLPKHPRVGPADKEIGQRIRLRRVEVEMSQHTLAEELGLSFQQIQKYEMGVNRVNTQRLQQIATALRIPISFFYDGANAKQQEVESLLTLNATLGLRLLRAYASIKSPSMQRSLLILTEELARVGR